MNTPAVRYRPPVPAETATHLLHRLTSYEGLADWDGAARDERLVDVVPQDPATLPYWWKRYDDGLPRIPLPERLPTTTAPATAVLAGTADVPRAELDLPQLARLLFLSAGVVRIGQRPGGRRIPFRAAGSAGGRFPSELYVAVPDGTALPSGVHWYDPERHELVRLAPPPHDGAPTLVVTSVPWRTGWKYRERGYRHLYWDAGTMLAQTLAAADSAGVPAALVLRFPDAAVSALVGADGVHEFPVALVTLGGGGPALESTGPAATGEVDAAPVEMPLATSAQRAGDTTELGVPLERGAPARAAAPGRDTGEPLEQVVLRRGSQRLMDPAGRLPRAVLTASLAAALRGIDVPHWVVVHAVDDTAPGVYRWPDLDTWTRAGDLRDELYRVALDQNLAAECCFVVVGATDLSRLDARGYRAAQLFAGVVEGRLHLMAYALGAAASGMTFLDGDIPALLGADVGGLLFTCVGVPEYRSRAGGGPGRPSTVTNVVPRMGE